MYLDATNKSISIVLGEARGAADCDITVSYEDLTPTTFVSGAHDLVSNGTTPVVVVAAPADATARRVRELNLYNNDNISHTGTVYYVDGANQRVIWSGVLAPAAILNYNGGTWNNNITGSTGLTGASGGTGGIGGPGGTGADGGTGGTGGVGSTGAIGAGLNWRGDYSAASTYVVLDAVYFTVGSSYVCAVPLTAAQ